MTMDEDVWARYAASVRELDQVRRDAVAAVVAQRDAAGIARAQIAMARQRAASQRSRFIAVTARLSSSRARVELSDSDLAGTSAAVSTSAASDPAAGISTALRAAAATLDAADATLSMVVDRPARAGLPGRWRPAARNVIVYLWYAALSLIAIVAVDRGAGPGARTGLLVTAAVIGTAVAALMAWLSIGALFASVADGDRCRSTWLGVLICALPLVIEIVVTGR